MGNKAAGIFFKNLNPCQVTIARLVLGFWVLLGSGQLAAALPYKNHRFGYCLEVPQGLTLQSRRADDSEIVWQTGTFRVTVTAANNPYGIKPHELFETVRSQAGSAIVEEWKRSGDDYYLYHLVYVKNGRQFHKRVYVSGGAINSIELSYARAWEREKAPVARRILRGFRHGNLLELH